MEEDKLDNNPNKEMIKGIGSQHIMSTEIVPSDNLWKNEDDFDGTYIDYSFATINRANRQIIFDLRQNINSMFIIRIVGVVNCGKYFWTVRSTWCKSTNCFRFAGKT